MLTDQKVIFLVDCQSFYASVEKAAHPEYHNKPVAVGDPERKSGIILAACPIAKSRGVTTAERVGEALAKCPELVVIRPRMQTYIDVSLLITEIYESITPLVEPYSIDEQFLDVTGSITYFGTPEEIARLIQQKVMLSTGVWTRVGIGPTKILAKMATDNFAKKTSEGIFNLTFENIETELWPLPIHQMFMVANRMTNHFWRMGISTIGDLARLDLNTFKRMLRQRMGRQSDIKAEYYWQTAKGIDPSPVVPDIRNKLKSVSHGKALRSSLYTKKEDIELVLLELVIEVCRRARRHGFLGRVVSVFAAETDGERSYGFNRQMTLDSSSALTHEIATAALNLFNEHWGGRATSHLGVSLNQLSSDNVLQLDLFDDLPKIYNLERVTDDIKERFGDVAIMRASSLKQAGVARERAAQIGGHFK